MRTARGDYICNACHRELEVGSKWNYCRPCKRKFDRRDAEKVVHGTVAQRNVRKGTPE